MWRKVLKRFWGVAVGVRGGFTQSCLIAELDVAMGLLD